MLAIYVATIIFFGPNGQMAVDSSQRFTTEAACELYGTNVQIAVRAHLDNIAVDPFCALATNEVVGKSTPVAR